MQWFNFESLPVELKLEAIRKVAHQPNRVRAREELANLLKSNKHIAGLISQTPDIKESADALGRHRGVESCYIALYHDVVRGISVKDALRQNGPLPKDDQLTGQGVNNARQYAGPSRPRLQGIQLIPQLAKCTTIVGVGARKHNGFCPQSQTFSARII